MVKLPIAYRLLLAVYDGLWLLVLAGWSVFVLLRRRADWRSDLRDRLGWATVRPSGARCALWIHAVSVGELLSIVPVILAVKRREPSTWVVVTISNDRAFSLSQRIQTGADAICRTPWDSGGCVRRAMRRLRPDALAIVECEIWPNMILCAARSGARVLMLNARIYERDIGKYLAAKGIFGALLAHVESIHVQSSADRARFLSLGVSERQIETGGNTKFDAAPPAKRELPAELASRIGRGGPVWVLASTHEGEELAVLSAARGLLERHGDLQIVIAPRDISRTLRIASIAESLGYRAARRTDPRAARACSVLLLDTLGELAGVLSMADVVFVGGSLVPKGGHNPIEAIALGKPTILGPHFFNFADVVEVFQSADAIRVVSNAEQVCLAVGRLLEEPGVGAEMGRRGIEVVEKHRGTADRFAALLLGRAQRRAAA